MSILPLTEKNIGGIEDIKTKKTSHVTKVLYMKGIIQEILDIVNAKRIAPID